MTKKKRELIEILLDAGITPETWPKKEVYAAQDKETYTWGKNALMFYTDWEFPRVKEGSKSFSGEKIGNEIALPELCRDWNKTIVTRDEFVKRWNERNAQDEKKTPQQLALEKFGTDWHENDGSCPVCDDVIIEVTHENGVKSDQQDKASEWLWGQLTGGWTILKWRIHSETDATTQPAQQELRTEETKPIQQEVKATDTQVGGNHYTKLAIQPMRYSMENGLDALQHTIIKYVTRFRDKAGIEDLEKAKHCIDMLIEFERNKK